MGARFSDGDGRNGVRILLEADRNIQQVLDEIGIGLVRVLTDSKTASNGAERMSFSRL